MFYYTLYYYLLQKQDGFEINNVSSFFHICELISIATNETEFLQTFPTHLLEIVGTF